MKLYQKLLEIQKHVDSFTKDGKGYNYKFTKGSTVLNAIRPLMNIHGLLLKQEVIGTKHQVIEYNNAKGELKTEVLAMTDLRFTWIDAETSETDVCLFAADGMNGFDKGLGSALTYGERYFFIKYFHIPTDEDDNDALGEKSGHKTKATPQADDDKPWLNLTTKDGEPTEYYERVKASCLNGSIDLKATYDKFKVNKKVREQIDAWIAEGKND